jgi:signal transduction histidine kinase
MTCSTDENRGLVFLKRLINSVFYGVGLGFMGSMPLAHALTLLDRATATVETATDAGTRPAVAVKLPYNWNRELGGASGKAHFVIKFSASQNGPPQALFIRRIGNSFELAVNGEMLAKAGVHGDLYGDSSTRPRLFLMPPHLLRADNVVDITIGAVSGRNAGIGLVYAGSVEEMSALYNQALLWRNSAYLVILVVSILLGGLVFLLWLRQRENLFLYYALSELLWAVHLSDIQFEASPLPWPWWGILTYSSYALASGYICKFALTLIGKHNGWIKRLIDIQIWLTAPVIALALVANRPGLLSIWLGLSVTLCSIVAVKVMRHALGTRSVEQRLLAVAVAITCAAAIRDLYVFRILPGYGGFPMLVFAWAAFGLCMAWIIAERLHASTQSIRRMNRKLAQRLAQREEELGLMFDSQASLNRRQAVMDERQRIMRDMHDGIGSQLVSAVHLVKDPTVSRSILIEQLQDALDNLKLTVDAMQDTDGDIAMLLGALRYRLSPRFEAIGVALSWEVAALPIVQHWTIQKSRHLQLILFEAISNVIAHAKATRAHLRAESKNGENGEEIYISLEDNGVGFPMGLNSGASGHGLANMRARAASIGAAIEILFSSKGTRLNLTIPVRTISRG